MCKCLKINKKTYYKYKGRNIDKDRFDFEIIHKVFLEGKETYGVKRIKKSLQENYNICMNHKKIRRIMRKYGLIPKYIQIFKRKTRQEVLKENIRPNILNRDFNACKPNEKWVTDITYLITKNKRRYLCTILDLYNRKVVAYKISDNMDLPLVISTLLDAIEKRKGNTEGLIIHSDQGSQYTSYAYQQICMDNGMTISMSAPGTPGDNAPMESYHSSLKRETLYSNYYHTNESYVRDVINWIEFYNTKRIQLRNI